MTIKRKALVPLLMAALAVSACAPGESGSSSSSSSDKEVKLTVWSWRVEDTRQYEEIFDVYEAKNPGVTVEFKPFKNTEYNQILATGLTGSKGPDVVQLKAYGGLQALVDSKSIVPLDGEIAGLDGFNKDVLAGLTARSDKRVYGVPFAIQTLQVFYNKAIFTQHGLTVPTTWPEFLSVAKTLADKDLTPIAMAGADAQVSVPVAADALMSARYGGSDFAKAVQRGEKDFTAPEYVAALKLMKELQPYFSDNVTGTSYDDARMQFITGSAGMYIGGVWEAGFFRQQKADLDFGVFDVPPGEGWASDKALTPGFVDGGFGIAANSAQPEAAKKLVAWMATAEFGQLFADKMNQVSPVPGVTLNDPIQKQAAEGFADHGSPYLMLVDFRYGQPWGTDLVGKEVQRLWLDEVDAAEAAANIQKGISQWFTPSR